MDSTQSYKCGNRANVYRGVIRNHKTQGPFKASSLDTYVGRQSLPTIVIASSTNDPL